MLHRRVGFEATTSKDGSRGALPSGLPPRCATRWQIAFWASGPNPLRATSAYRGQSIPSANGWWGNRRTL